ncbi:MAG: hypothetical protein AAGA80_04320 [Cyanobacteria bacterium P01_F01_bin.143]
MSPLVCVGSDHIDFVGGIKHTEEPRQIDLSDLYAWVPEEGKLVVALNTFLHPANTAPEFDGSVEYSFEIRKVELKESLLSVPEVQKDFSANVTCKPVGDVPNCVANVFRAGQLEIKNVSRAVAGRKADSFFLDVNWAEDTMKRVIDPNLKADAPVPPPEPKNFSDVINILNLTVEIDVADVLGEEVELIAVAGESFTEENGSRQRRDRVGRPEITNMTMGLEDVKLAYNQAPTFDLSSEQISNNKALIRYGVLGWDRQDNKDYKADWPHNGELHNLLDILVLDALIVDTTKTCDFEEQSFLDIERGQGKHTSCGGRVPKDDVIDTMVSFYTAGINASNDAYGDGVDKTVRQPKDVWPYFVAP